MPPTATRLLSYFRNSSSLPGLAAADDGKTYVVKWNGSGEGVQALTTDLVCLALAGHSGLPVPVATPISITEDLAQQTMDPDLSELISRSHGLGLGVEYLPKVRRFTAEHAAQFPEQTRRRIYLFDVLFLNIDRSVNNPNLLLSDSSPYCIDFASSLTVKSILDDREVTEAPFIPLLRHHPFYETSPPADSLDLTTAADNLEDILASIPDEWLDTPKTRTRLHSSLDRLLPKAQEVLTGRLALVDAVVPESEEEWNRRTRANRDTFEAAVAALRKKLD